MADPLTPRTPRGSVPPWRQAVGALAVPAAGGAAAFLAWLSFFAAVRRLDSLWGSVAVAVMVFVTIAAPAYRFALPWVGRRIVVGLCLGVGIVLGGWAWTSFFRPMGFDYLPAEELPGIEHVQLRTGSRIAYRHEPPSGSPERPFPVVFLHGGPGLPELPGEAVVSALGSRGFHVYGYHQFGAGLSSRAEDPRREYTVARQVADLEALRQTWKAERLILVGQSWGGALAAHYAAAFPRRVASLVLTSPAPVWLPAHGIESVRALHRLSAEDLEALEDLISPHVPRLAFRARLEALNPAVADELVGEEEQSAFAQAQTRITAKALACDPAAAEGLVFPGQGGQVNRFTFADMERLDDPRPRLRRVDVPVLILRPSCDYVDPAVAEEYAELFPRARLVSVEGAGHEIQLERPDAYIQRILSHLTVQKAP